VKDETTDDDDRGKNEVDYWYFGDYYRGGHRVAIRFRLDKFYSNFVKVIKFEWNFQLPFGFNFFFPNICFGGGGSNLCPRNTPRSRGVPQTADPAHLPDIVWRMRLEMLWYFQNWASEPNTYFCFSAPLPKLRHMWTIRVYGTTDRTTPCTYSNISYLILKFTTHDRHKWTSNPTLYTTYKSCCNQERIQQFLICNKKNMSCNQCYNLY
jgi:hypothetical protein